MNREQAFVALAHAQLIELWAEDLLQTHALVPIESGGEMTLQGVVIGTPKQTESQPAKLKPDTEKTAYLHNHGYTPEQINAMSFPELQEACLALVKKTGKSVVGAPLYVHKP